MAVPRQWHLATLNASSLSTLNSYDSLTHIDPCKHQCYCIGQILLGVRQRNPPARRVAHGDKRFAWR